MICTPPKRWCAQPATSLQAGSPRHSITAASSRLTEITTRPASLATLAEITSATPVTAAMSINRPASLPSTAKKELPTSITARAVIAAHMVKPRKHAKAGRIRRRPFPRTLANGVPKLRPQVRPSFRLPWQPFDELRVGMARSTDRSMTRIIKSGWVERSSRLALAQGSSHESEIGQLEAVGIDKA